MSISAVVVWSDKDGSSVHSVYQLQPTESF